MFGFTPCLQLHRDRDELSDGRSAAYQDEILAVCKLHGFLGIPSVEVQLQALDKEYQHLKEQGQSTKADYIQTLYVWLSKKTGTVSKINVDIFSPENHLYYRSDMASTMRLCLCLFGRIAGSQPGCLGRGEPERHPPSSAEIPGRLVSESRQLGVQPARGPSAAAAGQEQRSSAASAERPGSAAPPSCPQVRVHYRMGKIWRFEMKKTESEVKVYHLIPADSSLAWLCCSRSRRPRRRRRERLLCSYIRAWSTLSAGTAAAGLWVFLLLLSVNPDTSQSGRTLSGLGK